MRSETSAPEMKIFWPFRSQPPSPAGCSVVAMAKELVPASGSVMAKHMRSAPVTVGATSRRHCSSLPWRRMASRAKAVRMNRATGTPAEEMASMAATTSVRCPPAPP